MLYGNFFIILNTLILNKKLFNGLKLKIHQNFGLWSLDYKVLMPSDNKIQEMYNEIKEAQKKKKELQTAIKDAFENYKEYQEIKEQMEKLKVRRKEIENQVRQQYASEFNDLDDVKTDIKDTKMVLSDMMWNMLMKNEKIEVVDEYNTKYVPQVVVSLRKEG